MTDFRPQKHGFHFGNGFVNHVLDVDGLPEITTKGLCGGMAFAALDYYHAGFPIPTHLGINFPGGQVPPDDSTLRGYIYDRLLDSFVQNGLRFVDWTTKQDHYTVLGGDGLFELTKNEEFPKLMQRLQSGPVALGLISARWLWEIGENHQVVAYGAELDAAGTMTVYIYDNNAPDQEVTLTRTSSQGRFWSSLRDVDGNAIPYRGWFVENYDRRSPFYVDLAVVNPLTISRSFVAVGDPLDCTCTVKNFGEFPANIQTLNVETTVPAGEPADAKFAADTTAAYIQPQEEHVFRGHCDCFAGRTGQYTLQTAYVQQMGVTITNMPTAFQVHVPHVGLVTQFVPTRAVSIVVNSLSSGVTAPPPHVESIEAVYVTDGASDPLKSCEFPRKKYRAKWVQGDTASTRRLTVFSEPILPLPNRTLLFNVKFSTPGAMRRETVKLTLVGQAPDGSAVNVAVPLDGSGDFFTGRWKPQQRGSSNYQLTLRIEGADDYPRYARRTQPGNVLDKNPQTVATVNTARAGYPFQNYEPGTDSSYTIELAARRTTMDPDSLEPNDSFGAAREVALTGTTVDHGVWQTLANLNFHSATDQDFFLVRYESLPDDDTWPSDGPTTEVLSEYPLLRVTTYPPSLCIQVQAFLGLCTEVSLYPDPVAGGQQYGPYIGDYRLYAPTRVFANKRLYAVLRNASFPYQGAFPYNVDFGYVPGLTVTSGSSQGRRDVTDPQLDIERVLLKEYYDMVDLPRPPDELLNYATDRSFPIPEGAYIVTDRGQFVRRTEEFFTAAETLSTLEKAVGPQQAQGLVARAIGNLGRFAAGARLDAEAERLYQASAEALGAARLPTEQIQVLEELAAFYDSRLMPKQAEKVRMTIMSIRNG